jgi:hypothetical protein
LKQVRELTKLDEEWRYAEHKLQEQQKELQQMRERLNQQSDNQKRQQLLEHEMKLLKASFNTDLKDKQQLALNNIDEDIQDA